MTKSARHIWQCLQDVARERRLVLRALARSWLFLVADAGGTDYVGEGVDLSGVEGVQVVCSRDGAILTVYRNKNFRGLRPRGGRRHDRLAA